MTIVETQYDTQLLLLVVGNLKRNKTSDILKQNTKYSVFNAFALCNNHGLNKNKYPREHLNVYTT